MILFVNNILMQYVGIIIAWICVFRLTYILQFKICTFTVTQRFIVVIRQLWIQRVIISSVVWDIQFSVSVHKREVSVTIQTSYTVLANGNEIFIKQVYNWCRRITKYRLGIGINPVRTSRYISACKDGILDCNTRFIYLFPFSGLTYQCV